MPGGGQSQQVARPHVPSPLSTAGLCSETAVTCNINMIVVWFSSPAGRQAGKPATTGSSIRVPSPFQAAGSPPVGDLPQPQALVKAPGQEDAVVERVKMDRGYAVGMGERPEALLPTGTHHVHGREGEGGAGRKVRKGYLEREPRSYYESTAGARKQNDKRLEPTLKGLKIARLGDRYSDLLERVTT